MFVGTSRAATLWGVSRSAQEKLLLSAMPLDQSSPRRLIFSRAFLPNDLMIAHFNPPLAGSFCDMVILLPTQIDEGYIYL